MVATIAAALGACASSTQEGTAPAPSERPPEKDGDVSLEMVPAPSAGPRAAVSVRELSRGPAEPPRDREAACCKGKNDCKGKGNCRVEGDHECKGMNECKGHGGCRAPDCQR